MNFINFLHKSGHKYRYTGMVKRLDGLFLIIKNQELQSLTGLLLCWDSVFRQPGNCSRLKYQSTKFMLLLTCVRSAGTDDHKRTKS